MEAENPFFSPEGLSCFSFLFILVFNVLIVYYLYKLHVYLIPSAHISWSSFLSNHSSPHYVCFCWCGSCASGHSCCMFVTAMVMSHSEDSILQDPSPPSISHHPASHFPQCALRLLHNTLVQLRFLSILLWLYNLRNNYFSFQDSHRTQCAIQWPPHGSLRGFAQVHSAVRARGVLVMSL